MRPIRLATALGMVVVVALAAGGIAVATDGGDSDDRDRGKRPGEGFALPAPSPVFFHDRGERRDQFAKDLAEELDIEAEEVKEALRAVFEKNLDRAVEEGWLTRKQADRILECHDGDEEDARDEEDACRPPRIGRPPLPHPPGFGHGLRGRFPAPERLRERLERFRGRALPLPPPPGI